MSLLKLILAGLAIAFAATPVIAIEDVACDDLDFVAAIPGGFVTKKAEQRLNMNPASLKKGWEKLEICPIHGACYERFQFTNYWKNVSQWRAKVCLQLAESEFEYAAESFSGEAKLAKPVVRFVTRDSKKEPWRLLTEHAYGIATFKNNPKTFAWMYEGKPRTVGIQIISATAGDYFDLMVDKSKKPIAPK